MNGREKLHLPLGILPVTIGALLVVLIVTIILGLNSPLFALLAVGTALDVAAWALVQFRREKAAHEATLAKWTVYEAVFAERMRIARDLHDIISHGLGMITVRAATAKYLHAKNWSAEEMLEAIDDVENLSRRTTFELRHMLEAMRENDEPAPRYPVDTLS